MISLVPVWVRARRSARSLASVPVQTKKQTLRGSGKVAVSLERVLGQVVVQIAGVGVELGHLALPGGDHLRVAVADVADVVDQVEDSAGR